jgi:hypothetical protein
MTFTIEPLSKLDRLVENYAEHIVEGLDTESLQMMVYDLLVREYSAYTEEQIVGEIKELYGEEVAAEFYNDVTVVEVAQEGGRMPS